MIMIILEMVNKTNYYCFFIYRARQFKDVAFLSRGVSMSEVADRYTICNFIPTFTVLMTYCPSYMKVVHRYYRSDSKGGLRRSGSVSL